MPDVAAARTYDDSCGIARALDLVGERWALLVVRELVLGPKRFGQLRRGLPGTSPNVLSQRLRELEDAGVVTRQELEPPASVVVYDLTPRGRELEPVLHTLGRWGSAAPLTSGNELSADALLVALTTMFSPRAARDLDATYQLVVDGDAYTVRVADGGIEIRRGRAHRPIASLDTDRTTLRKLVFGGASLETALARGAATTTGPRRALVRFLGLFPK
jgi:DNA-binding HxlR family transcriptional regulator